MPTPLSYADYAALPDDGQIYELIEGERVVTPSPGLRHQWVVLELAVILREHVKRHHLGIVVVAPFDVILSEKNAPTPDIVYAAREREESIAERGVEGAPTLAVEVLSPNRPANDLVVKRRIYRQHGIRHYWIADPEKRTLESLVLGRDDYRTEAKFSGAEEATRMSPFPDIVIPLAEVWMPPRRS